MSESYNSPGSPYWAIKAFAPLALPEDHPFWRAEEAPPPEAPTISAQPAPGMLVYHPPGDAVALASGQHTLQFRHGPEKYAKLAYSAHYAFSVEGGDVFERAVLDSVLGLSDDGRHFRTREDQAEARIGADHVFSRWRPWDDVTVETWLLPRPPGHLRIHRIVSARPLQAAEGGFAIAASGPILQEAADATALVATAADASAIADASSTVPRIGRILKAPPNTNLIAPRTWVPQLAARIAPGETILRCRVIAGPSIAPGLDTVRAWLSGACAVPDLAALAALPATPVVTGLAPATINRPTEPGDRTP